jgi:hypothetical protein
MRGGRIGRRRKNRDQLPGPSIHWLRVMTLILTAICLLGLFSQEISDTDFWWHLKTGQYIVETHRLPVPDPFAYTTSISPAYAGEETVRHFNLTHEWLSQVLMYTVYAIAGFPGIVLTRVLLLATLCALAGFLAARLSTNFYTGIAAACATASVLIAFTADRPGIVSFLGVAVFVTLLEMRRFYWALPAIALLWSNAHGGFPLGWLVLLAYCFGNRRLWLPAACAIAVSGINPNGFHVVSTILAYRRSPMTANLIEWMPPKFWGPPYGFDILLYAAALTLILSWRKVRLAHWLLFAAFAGASLMAFRNIPLIGFLAPILIAAYLPLPAKVPAVLACASLGLAAVFARVPALGVATWTVPSGAADYLLEHHVPGPIFNTYEQGGYLIWRLWPQNKVFIDGRSLSEAVYRDYHQILFTGPRDELLNRYGVQVVVMNTMDYVSGALYPLALFLADPSNTEWDLVYEDTQAVIFQRHSPQPNKLGRVLRHFDKECAAYIENSPDDPLCARTLAQYWLRNQVKDSARRMLVLYLAHRRDPQAERLLRELDFTTNR